MIGIKVPVCDRDFNLKVNRQKFPVTKIAFLNNLLKEKSVYRHMKIFQHQLQLAEKKRGFHLVTEEIIQQVQKIREIKKGICHVFIQHTSASLTINENADPTVRKDFETWFNHAVPDNGNYSHNTEGDDDMPAHIKASLLNSFIMIPIQDGRLALGIWQGIYLCEHRDQGGRRNLLITIWGE